MDPNSVCWSTASIPDRLSLPVSSPAAYIVTNALKKLMISDWGDMISVTVTNAMQDNGTGIHWHGIRQLGTNGMDGTGGLTECKTRPLN